MNRLPLLVLVALAGCASERIYRYPEPLPPPSAPPPVAEAPAAPEPAVVHVHVEQAAAQPEVRYFDGHPLPEEYGGGWCLLAGPHTHAFQPLWVEQYVYRDRAWYFGASIDWSYHGAHPLPPELGGGWCMVTGAHTHLYRPWSDYRYDQTRHVYVYRPEHSRPQPPRYDPPARARPVPARTQPARPQPSRPEPRRPEPSRPQPSRPEPSRPQQNPRAAQPSQPNARPQPIPYGDDVRPVRVPAPAPSVPRPAPAQKPRVDPKRPALSPQRDVDAGVVRPAPRLPRADGEGNNP